MDYEKILIFNIAGKEFAVNIKDVDRILSHSNITFVPEQEYFIEGIIDYSDDVINVINLAKLFSIEEIDDEDVILIVVASGEKKVALKTNNGSKIVDLNQNDKESIPQLALEKNSFLKGIVKFEGKLIILLDIDKIMEIN